MRLTQFAIDDSAHNRDGLVLHGWDGAEMVTAFISRRVMDDWVDPRQSYGGRRSLFRQQYNALGNAIFQRSNELPQRSISVAQSSMASIRS
jgi:hypothetical protein